LKVKNVIELMKNRLPSWICGADTIISVDGDIYGKPADREDAKTMLSRLQGRDHEVITAVALYNGREKSMDCRSVVSTVSFARLSENEIEWYLNTGEWQGVAGAYKIQGLASCFITLVHGSPSSVVGLPIREFYVMLRENGYPYGG
jgi:septum formation protein